MCIRDRSGNECPIFKPRTATCRLRTSNKVPFAPSHRPLQDSMVKNRNDPRTMSLRSINLKIGRLSGNECVIFEPRTATCRLRTSSKVPFAPSHRRLQDSMVKNQNDQRTMNLRSKNIKLCRLSGNECAIFKPRTGMCRLKTCLLYTSRYF